MIIVSKGGILSRKGDGFDARPGHRGAVAATDGVVNAIIRLALNADLLERILKHFLKIGVKAGKLPVVLDNDLEIILIGNGVDIDIPCVLKDLLALMSPCECERASETRLLGAAVEVDDEYDDKEYIEKSYDDEVKKIMAVVRKYGEKYGCLIPVVLAGGIYDRAAAKHAFSLGVDGIQVATRFVTTEECDADIRYKEAYIRANKEDIQIVKSPVGMPGRAIMNSFMERVMAGERISPKKCLLCMKGCKPSEIPYCITESLLHAAKGEVDEALLFCGAEAWRAEKIETVEEVMDDLLQA